MATKSPRSRGHQILGVISSERVEAVLYEWVNLPERILSRKDIGKAHPAYDRMIARYPEMFPFTSKAECYRVLTTVRVGLRQIWNSSDIRQRDWTIFVLRNAYQKSRTREVHGLRDLFESQSENDFFPPVPELTPFEAAMVHLQIALAYRMLYCPNPECAAPFFFRAEKGQKSCSPECGDWLRRKSKLRWYHEAPNSPKNKSLVPNDRREG